MFHGAAATGGRNSVNCHWAGEDDKDRSVAPAKLDVTVLGSSDAFCSGGHFNAAYLFATEGARFLVDCGPTTLCALKQRGIDTGSVDFAIVSHLHGDHFGGLPFLVLEYMYENPRRRPFTILGPPGIEERIWTLIGALYHDVMSKTLPFELRFQELVPEQTTRVGNVDILPVRVPHQMEEMSLAVRIDVNGKRVLYSGDTPWIDRFFELARGTDLFLCECTAYSGAMGRHIEFTELQRLLPRIETRRIVLIHLGRAMRDHAATLGVECATEGMSISV